MHNIIAVLSLHVSRTQKLLLLLLGNVCRVCDPPIGIIIMFSLFKSLSLKKLKAAIYDFHHTRA
jgi:hypothetical protein